MKVLINVNKDRKSSAVVVEGDCDLLGTGCLKSNDPIQVRINPNGATIGARFTGTSVTEFRGCHEWPLKIGHEKTFYIGSLPVLHELRILKGVRITGSLLS